MTTINGGMNLGQLFQEGAANIGAKGQDLQAQMKEISKGGEIKQEDMLALQFQMGQYNALMESLSSVTKSMTDMLKSLAQRTG